MSKEKQIDEMAKLICTYPQCIHYNIIGACANAECQISDIAEQLYNTGYRKASEIAREMSTMLREDLRGFVDANYLERLLTIYEKKYIGEDTNVRTNTEEWK